MREVVVPAVRWLLIKPERPSCADVLKTAEQLQLTTSLQKQHAFRKQPKRPRDPSKRLRFSAALGFFGCFSRAAENSKFACPEGGI
jgi:hypothetical protein